MKLLEFLNKNSGAFAVIFSGLVSIATIIYAVLTWRLVAETKKMREAQTEPKISVSIQPKEVWLDFIDMVIQNIGLGPAYDIKINVEPDFEYEKGRFLSELGVMKNGIKYFAPGQKIQFYLTRIDSKEKMETVFKIIVTYQNSIGKKYKDEYLVDFSQFMGLSRIGKPPLHDIADSLKKIEDGRLKDLTNRFKELIDTMKNQMS